ncbi:unnamed protein product [Prunus brigantina]
MFWCLWLEIKAKSILQHSSGFTSLLVWSKNRFMRRETDMIKGHMTT